MFEVIFDWVVSNIFAMIGVVGIGGLLGLILRKFVRKDTVTSNLDDWMRANGKYVREFFSRFGRLTSLNVTRWPIIGLCWNKVIEPYLIFGANCLFKVAIWLVQNIVDGYIKGLQSDNPNFAGESKKEAKVTARKIEVSLVPGKKMGN